MSTSQAVWKHVRCPEELSISVLSDIAWDWIGCVPSVDPGFLQVPSTTSRLLVQSKGQINRGSL